MAERIEDYAMIGDCETAALVSHRGSIDWLCWPHFSSPACFAALLGTEENGHWSIAPKDGKPGTRRYLDHTLVLETRFETDEGAVVLLDFMPIRGGTCCDLVRIVRGVRGTVPMTMQLVLRFDYGRSVPWVTRTENGGIRAIAGPDMVLLKSPVETHGENLKTLAEFTVHQGETVSFVLTYALSYEDPHEPSDAEKALEATVRFWRDWAGRSKLNGGYADAVERSLITLKALTFQQTGGIVAAATTSLPEWIGGPRNWDYRFCWLRDATGTLLALMNAGYFDEACAWRDWLLRATMGSPDQAQIMYGIRGERQLLEWEVDGLPGYEGSKPVRVGNAAAVQLQLDVYGDVADTFFQGHLGGIPGPETSFALQRALTDHLATCWNLPDHGIWEVRGEPQHFTFSKVMAWVAFDRTIKTSEKFGLQGEVKWRALRQGIHDEICERGYDPKLGSFVQAYGSKEVDASLLLMPLVGFLPFTDPRIRRTVEAIEKNLLVDGFVLRYRTEHVDDGLPEGEGAFLACSFWMVRALQMLGREDEARRMFDRLLGLRNDVGLLAEEYDSKAQRQLGNFPQALSHIALINAAFELGRATSPGRQRGEASSAQPEVHGSGSDGSA